MRARRERQRGAAAIFAAVGLIALISATGLAVDLGQLYYAKRDLQRLANLAALDAISAAGSCQNPNRFESLAEREQYARQQALLSIQRNGGESAYVENGGSVRIGRKRVDGGLRSFSSQASVVEIDAVQVKLRRPVPPRIMKLPGLGGARTLQVTAAAAQAPVVSLAVGSQLLDLDPGGVPVVNEVLASLIGEPLDLSLISYEGLVSSEVPLEELVAAQGEELSVEEFLREPTTAPAFFEGLARSLLGSADEAAVALQELAGSSENMNEFIPGDVVRVPDGTGEQVGGATLPVFELVRAAAQQAGNAVFEITPDVEIPGVVRLGGTVSLVEPAQIAVGPALLDEARRYVTRARNAQGQLTLDVELLPLPVLGNPPVNLRLELEVASSEAALTRLRCASRDRREHEVGVEAQSGLAELRLPTGNPVLNLELEVLGQPVAIRVRANGSVRIADPTVEQLTFGGPFGGPGEASLPDNVQSLNTSTASALANAVSDLANNVQFETEVELLESAGGALALLPGATGSVEGLVNDFVSGQLLPALGQALDPVLQRVAAEVLAPATGALGLKIPGADIMVSDVRVPQPTLIEN